MFSKDYYQILDISPTASFEEIKKAYRKMALAFHPDTTTNDPIFSAEKFREIQEAYEVLSDTKKRQEYHFKKFYKKFSSDIQPTPQSILQQSEELAKLVAVLDPYRIDYDKLNHQIEQTLNTNKIKVLQQLNDSELNKKVIENLLQCTLLLPYEFVLQQHQTLLQIANQNADIVTMINKQTSHQHLLYQWDKYKLLMALIIALLLSIGFWLIQ